MKNSRSVYLPVRGLEYHCRTWGDERSRLLVLLHGFQDASASWQFMVDALQGEWFVVAPDWRGYGLTQWSGADSYWFPDYLGDLDALLDRLSPDRPVDLVGHSMGGNVGGLYAGVRAQRIRSFVNIEGFGIGGRRQEPAPKRLARWLDELAQDVGQRPYESMEDFAARMQAENPRLSDERARFLAEHWGKEDPEVGVVRRADPAHKRSNPAPTSVDDLLECWRQIEAPVLWVEGAQSPLMARIARDPEAYEERKAAIADLRIERIEDAGHNVHHDQPERLAQVIEAFLRDRRQ